tara:strand:+ start:59 stop:166 length:108 start_codon:yes stop_codon:yes gene_type:complete
MAVQERKKMSEPQIEDDLCDYYDLKRVLMFYPIIL